MQAQAIKWRDAKIESITFQLARFKAWKFGARTEAMNAEQRALFDETCAADQASLEAQLAALQGATAGSAAPDKQPEQASASPSARPCRHTCRAWTSAWSPRITLGMEVMVHPSYRLNLLN